MGQTYNPLDKIHLGESVATALLRKERIALGSLPRTEGAGVYAIYYEGDFAPYSAMVRHNQTAELKVPIYVGKAVPKGSRRGGGEATVTSTGELVIPITHALFNRLVDHADSIRASTNLKIDDFKCRFLVVDDIWIPLAESVMIARTRPLWNRVVDGFGNHDPGAGRYQGQRSQWDTIHPGRAWAAKCRPNSLSQAQIEKLIRKQMPGLLTPQQPVTVAAVVTGQADGRRRRD